MGIKIQTYKCPKTQSESSDLQSGSMYLPSENRNSKGFNPSRERQMVLKRNKIESLVTKKSKKCVKQGTRELRHSKRVDTRGVVTM